MRKYLILGIWAFWERCAFYGGKFKDNGSYVRWAAFGVKCKAYRTYDPLFAKIIDFFRALRTYGSLFNKNSLKNRLKRENKGTIVRSAFANATKFTNKGLYVR